MPESYSLTLLCVGGDQRLRQLAREAAVLLLPGAQVADANFADLRQTPPGSAVVLCEGADRVRDSLRHVRATGFGGGVVVVAAEEERGSLEDDVARWGPAAVITPEALGTRLADVLQQAGLGGADPADPAASALQRARKIVAAGELAGGLQHALNNPLTALLAEAQLLEMEELSPDHREAVGKIIEHCRRVIAVVRQLDGVR